jgi:hypothetical protein
VRSTDRVQRHGADSGRLNGKALRVPKTVCILLRHPPYASLAAAEAVRHLNGALANGHRPVALLIKTACTWPEPASRGLEDGSISAAHCPMRLCSLPRRQAVRCGAPSCVCIARPCGRAV